LSSGVISKSNSAWAFPVVLALKSDGTYRFCVDYSKLNNITVRDTFPLPNIEDHLDQLQKAKIFTVVDLASGFWQIPVKEEDKEKLSFITSFGTYTFNFMPFGFVNAPSIFQRAISETLDPVLYSCALVYVDDIVIYSSSFSDHLNDLAKVFNLLGKFNWKIKLTKCQFANKSINYLGHKVEDGKLMPLERNLHKLKEMKQPGNSDEMISFLGLCGYYKKFIQGYDYIVHPLRKYTHKHHSPTKPYTHNENQTKENNQTLEQQQQNKQKKPKLINQTFTLSDDEEAFDSFQKLIALLSSEPILHLFDRNKPTILKTDVSGYAWGAVLAQEHEGIEFPVQYASGTLKSSERNWPAWKREAYGVLKALTKFKHYLEGIPFKIYTDHKANIYILDPKSPLNPSYPPIINNWKMLINQYNYTIHHRPGKTLVLEDALSRSPNLMVMEIQKIIEEQKKDPILMKIINYLEKEDEEILDKEIRKVLPFDIKNHFIIEDHSLFYLESNSKLKSRRSLRLCLPQSLISETFNNNHSLPIKGHMGWLRTWEEISKHYYYPNLYSITLNLYNHCHICQSNKITKHHNQALQSIAATEPFEILEMDHIVVGITSKQGYKYILTITDKFSLKVWFLPVKSLEATEVFKVLFTHIFSQFFFPRFIYSDQSSSFNNELDKLLCTSLGIQHHFTLPYSKGHTGSVEVRNKVVESVIKKYLTHYNLDNWDEFCWTAAYAYNKSMNSVTNYSPDYLIFGREPYSLVDLSSFSSLSSPKHSYKEHVARFVDDLERAWKAAKEATDQSHKQAANVRLKYLRGKQQHFHVGQLVLLIARGPQFTNYFDQSLNHKLLSQNIGPFEIINLDDQKHVTLQITPSTTKSFHLDQITPYSGNEIPFKEGHFTPQLDEIIIEKLPVPRKANFKEKILPDKEKKKYNVKSLVGKRIKILWKEDKKYYNALVIGYSTNLQSSLIAFDDPTIDKATNKEVDQREDYYKVFLFKPNESVRSEKWSLLEER
jgi:hypothetical protein